jgi:serine/threonine protein kinase
MVQRRSAPEPDGERDAIADDRSRAARSDHTPEARRDLPVHARAGYILADKYRVERVLGRGGMGLVVVARHLQLFEPVAIKFLMPEYQTSESVGRFMREAWAATKIKSEYVVRVTDVASLPDGATYIVMDYLDGEDLARALQHGPMSIEQGVELLLQMCEGLAEAHALGIVHRDLKPSNIVKILRSDGLHAIKVLDFGISKITHKSMHVFNHAATTSAMMMGSPFYMSPEQMRSTRDVDARTDIWALGAIAYEMLTGRKAFDAFTLPELVLQIATCEPPAPRTVRRELPRRLERVIMRCLEKKPDKRYDDVSHLAADLLEFAPARARSHAERAQRVLHSSALEREPRAAVPQARAPIAPIWRRAARFALLLMAAVAIGLWWFMQPRAAQPTAGVVKPVLAPAPSPPAPSVPNATPAIEAQPAPVTPPPEVKQAPAPLPRPAARPRLDASRAPAPVPATNKRRRAPERLDKPRTAPAEATTDSELGGRI